MRVQVSSIQFVFFFFFNRWTRDLSFRDRKNSCPTWPIQPHSTLHKFSPPWKVDGIERVLLTPPHFVKEEQIKEWWKNYLINFWIETIWKIRAILLNKWRIETIGLLLCKFAYSRITLWSPHARFNWNKSCVVLKV